MAGGDDPVPSRDDPVPGAVRDQPPRGWIRPGSLLVLAAGLVLLLGAAAFVIWSGLSSGRNGAVELTMDMRGYSRQTIRVRAGESVTVRMSVPESPFFPDGDGGEHQFAVDAFAVDLVVGPGRTGEVTFTPVEPGVYEFYCDTCCGGRVNPTMRGELIVEE